MLIWHGMTRQSLNEISEIPGLIKRFGTNGQLRGTLGQCLKNGSVPDRTGRGNLLFLKCYDFPQKSIFQESKPNFFSKHLLTCFLEAPNCISDATVPATTLVLALLSRHA